jgi:hypothetical protein
MQRKAKWNGYMMQRLLCSLWQYIASTMVTPSTRDGMRIERDDGDSADIGRNKKELG